jgi:cytochrome c556
MQMAERNILAIKKSLKGLDFQSANDSATMIQSWAHKMEYYFPLGSGASVHNLSAASDDIWRKLEVFKNLIKLNKKASDRMVIAAQSQNKEKLEQAVDAAVKSCNLCHNTFRN